MTRAYMSNPGEGPYFLDAPEIADAGGVVRVVEMTRDDEFAAAWAEREARAILAETEAETECLYYDYDAFPHSGARFWPVRALRQSDQARALAEALAGFCEREGL